MRRLGERGSDGFEEISWDLALDTVAERLADTRDHYGPEAILHITGAGSLGGRGFSGASASRRFFSYWASVASTHGAMSTWCADIANRWMLGGVGDAIDLALLLESRLIILWAANPAETRQGGNVDYAIARARDRGARVILIDPRHTDSAVLADEWIPIRPGTDAALIASIAHIWATSGSVDQGFMESRTVGYPDYLQYVLGESDGVAKTPGWASRVTGIPEDTIRGLARQYASTSPALILAGWGPQRSAYGEQTERALITLACMSGNVGLRGGGLAHQGRHTSESIQVPSLPAGPFSPVQKVRDENWGRFLLSGELQPQIRMAYIVAANAINRSTDTRANARALGTLDFVVVQDPYFTPTARYADIVLPVCLDLERPDVVRGRGDIHYNRQALAPRGKTRTDYWILTELAERLGFAEAYSGGKSECDWVEHVLRSSDLDLEVLRRDGIIKTAGDARAHLAEFCADPQAHPLDTPSGRIQIACPEAVENGLPLLPTYVADGPDEPGAHPLQLVTPHSKLRANSTGYANAWLQRLQPHRVWINPTDAETRGIRQDDTVEVTSPSGTATIRAQVTERIMPGVVAIDQGSWYSPEEGGHDAGACANTLTSHRLSPSGGMVVHSSRVQIRRSTP